MSPVLSLEGVSVHRGKVPVLVAATLQVGTGQVVGVVGPNGAGKTTLLRAALGLAPLSGGRVTLAGCDLASLKEARRADLAGYLPQERRVGWNLPAWRVASLGAVASPPLVAQQAALRALERVGLSQVADRGILDLSGGERARVLLARLLVTRAPLMMADEPAAGLDPDAQLLTLELFREEAVRGGAVVLTLHDLSLAARSCDRLVVMSQGRIVADAPPLEALTPAILRTVFGLEGVLQATENGPILSVSRARSQA